MEYYEIFRMAPGPWRRTRNAPLTAICAAAILAYPSLARAKDNINSGSTYNASALDSSVNPDFRGGTLKLDSSTTITDAFDVENYPTNTIDADGHSVTMSGAFTNSGPMTFTDSVGGGTVILTSSANAYTGATTINSGVTLALSGAGTIATSSGLADGGTFDISQTAAGASIISLTGAGAVNLGAQNLTITAGAGTFSGVISGTGSLILTSGTEILTGTNTYTGITTISGGTLEIGGGAASGSVAGNVADNGTLTFDRVDSITFPGVISGYGGLTMAGSGSLTLTAAETYTGPTTVSQGVLALASTSNIADSSGVAVNGTFDISATPGTSIKSLSGAGTVNLGAQTLTITDASGVSETSVFSGTISGTGNLVLTGGTQLLSGTIAYTGSTTINAGILEFGASTIANSITNNGAFAFDSGTAIAMSGVISGSGGVSQIGGGVTTITTPQTYTGVTTITAGTLALSGSGSIASSSNVSVAGIFDISAAPSGASIMSLSGTGTVNLGAQTLTLTSASGTYSGNITGTGGLTLVGGKEILSGTTAFTGVTTVSAGTLVLAGTSSLAASSRVTDNATLDISTVTNGGIAPSASIVSLAGSGTVFLGTKTLNLTNASDTFAGTLYGTGGLTVSGGTETLTAASPYTGLTTVSAVGTLALAGAGSIANSSGVAVNGTFDISAAGAQVTVASLSGTGFVNLDGRNLILNVPNTILVTAPASFSGVISGSGGLTVNGNGSQTLSGANTYTGGTVITAGTLQIGNGPAGGSIVGAVLDDGVLAFDRADSFVFSGLISGTGTVSQLGSGTTILTGANSYTGGTTIGAGTLQIGNGSASGAIVGSVTDNGTLAFGRTDSTTFNGTISGAGGIAQLSGTTILTAVETYTGPTAISGGTLALSSTGSIANSSGVADNGTFDISATSGASIQSLSGAGTVTLGAQSLTLTNASGTFSGAISGSGGVIVNGGLLAVNGSIAAGGVTVNSGGSLGGTGTVSAVTVNNGGTLAPGVAGSGTLTVNGSVAFNSGSNFLVNLTSTSAPKLVTTGAEALAGTLEVTSIDGTYALGQKLTVLTADGGVSGSFTLAPVQSAGGASFASALSYDADNVYLQVNLAKLSPLLPAGTTINQNAPIGGIDAAIAAGNVPPLPFENLGNISSAALGTDARQLGGEIAADIPQAGNALFAPFLNAIFDHISDGQQSGLLFRRNQQQTEVWASGFAGSTVIAGDADPTGSNRFKSSAAGFIGGADWRMAPNLILGAALSAGSTNFHIAGGLGDGKADGFQGGVYGLAQFGPRFYGSFAAAFAVDDVKTARVLTVSGTDDLNAKFTSGVYGGRYETGLALDWLTPYLALEDELFTQPAYSETASSGASSFALSYASRNTNMADIELGARQSGLLVRTRYWTLRVSDRLAWEHGLSGGADAHAAFAALPASGFTVFGAKSAKDSALVSLGADLENRNGLGLDMHFDSGIAAHFQTYTGMAGLNYRW